MTHEWIKSHPDGSAHLPVVANWLIGATSRKDWILDAGCGNGALCRLLQERGHDWLRGMDIEQSHVAAARDADRSGFGCAFYCHDFLAEPVGKPRIFAAIACMGWAHTSWPPDPDKARETLPRLSEAAKWYIAPRGYLLIDWPTHAYEFTPEEVTSRGWIQFNVLDAAKPVYIFRRE